MANGTQSPESSRSRWRRFKGWAGNLALLLGLVVAAILVAELGAVRALTGQIDAGLESYPWLIAIPIGLMVVGGVLMLGAQFLPAPRQQTPPTNEALDGASVSMNYREGRGRWSRSMEMEASTEQLREAWRRRSWRYSPRWRTFFLMMLGAVLLSAGLTGLFILIGPPFVKVLVAGLAFYAVERLVWEFAVTSGT
jgi:uncharacterized BrkB/YihY/UPF0761 family membrane protein